MFPVIPIFGMALQAPGLILLVGLWLGLVISERLAPRFKVDPTQLYNLVFVALISGVVGARLSYFLQYFQTFFENPLNLFSLNPGLLDPIGGVATALIAALIYGNRKQISWLPTLDALTPLLSVMIASMGLANLASGDAFGAETHLPWGINLWGMLRHPTQVYQSLAGVVILRIIWPRKSDSKKPLRVPGETFWLFLALSAVAWMIIEAFRGNSVLLFGGLRTNQMIAWVILAFSLWGFGRMKKRANRTNESV